MIDREKVIKGIMHHKLGQCDMSGKICPYWEEKADCMKKMLGDALTLLKEQETSNTGKARIFQCKKCGYGFDDIFLTDEHNYDIEPNYCSNCGRLVK